MNLKVIITVAHNIIEIIQLNVFNNLQFLYNGSKIIPMATCEINQLIV